VCTLLFSNTTQRHTTFEAMSVPLASKC